MPERVDPAPGDPAADSRSPRSEGRPPGLGSTFVVALAAAAAVGLSFGTIDAAVVAIRVGVPPGLSGSLGCWAAAVMHYAALAGALLVPLGLVAHPLFGRRCSRAMLRRLLIVGFAVGLFAEIYWWTRPYVFYGRSSVSPERIAAALAQGLLALGLGVVVGRRVASLPRAAFAVSGAVAVLCVAGGLLFVRSESARVESCGRLNERNRELPNVLLVVVDALRADHLGCYGNERIATPNVDGLAERGVVLESCFAQAPYTLTSFGSILTGKYPRRHGLVAQVAGVRMRPNRTLPLHLKSATIAATGERLRDVDYATGTFMTGALSHGSGLAQGFDVYSEAMEGHDPVHVDDRWSRFRSELLLWLFKNKLQQRIDSSLVVSTARDWIVEHRDRRWMAMVHLYSTHTPYDPPHAHREPYLDPAYDGPLDSFYAEHRYAIEAGEYSPTPEDIERIRDLYAGGTAQADAMIGELLGELEGLGVLDETVVIVTADHGEDLGEMRAVRTPEGSEEMRYWEHNHMWQTNLRIPFVISAPGRLPEGVRVETIVETIDILPTLCDLLGLELPAEDGEGAVDGSSFLPAVRTGAAGGVDAGADERFTFAENNLFLSIQDRRGKLVVPRALLQEDDPEAIFREDVWVRYFDLESDPDEARDLVGDRPEGARRLWAALREYDASMPKPEYIVTERDEEQMRWLSQLGYTGGIVPEEDGE